MEASILAELSPACATRFVPVSSGVLRVLEGGAGRVVVLLHGRGNAATTWFPLLPTLLRSFRVIAIDLPGFGASTASPIRRNATFEEGLEFFVRPVEEFLVNEGIGDAAIVGHSLGGLVALELALRKRVAPERLVFVAGMGLGPAMSLQSRAFFGIGPERLARVLGPRLFGRISKPKDTAFGLRLSALGFELYSIPEGRPEAARAFDSLFTLTGPTFHRRDRLREIQAPSLLIWGEHDEVFPVSIAREAIRLLRAELFIEPLGHSPHLERPETVGENLVRFLNVRTGKM